MLDGPKGTAALALLAGANGWERISASDERAYVRKGLRFLTWKKDGVTVATSGASLYYNPDRGQTEIYESNGRQAVLEFLGVEPGLRGQGRARRALTEWVRLAKETGVELFLQPEPQEPGINRKRLVTFYASAGFVAQELASPKARVMKLDSIQNEDS